MPAPPLPGFFFFRAHLPSRALFRSCAGIQFLRSREGCVPAQRCPSPAICISLLGNVRDLSVFFYDEGFVGRELPEM